MKLGLQWGYWGQLPPPNVIEVSQEADRLGFDSVWTAEAWGSDCFSPLAWIAGHTERIRVGTAIALGNLVLLLLMLALGRSGAATAAWAVAVGVAAVWLGLSPLSPTSRIVTGFVLAQATAFVLLLGLSIRLPARARPAAADRQVYSDEGGVSNNL